jgi:hypothetical protein
MDNPHSLNLTPLPWTAKKGCASPSCLLFPRRSPSLIQGPGGRVNTGDKLQYLYHVKDGCLPGGGRPIDSELPEFPYNMKPPDSPGSICESCRQHFRNKIIASKYFVCDFPYFLFFNRFLQGPDFVQFFFCTRASHPQSMKSRADKGAGTHDRASSHPALRRGAEMEPLRRPNSPRLFWRP